MALRTPFDINATQQGGKRVLQQMLPAGWRFAHQTALDLISQIEHLAWQDRADKLDIYFTQQADGMLGAQQVGAMIGGRLSLVHDDSGVADTSGSSSPESQAAGFAKWCRAVTTAVMVDLDHSIDVEEPTQALTYLVARDWQFAKSAAAWVAEHGMTPVADALKKLPGYAIVLLATSPNDTVERFMARDAFWQAVQTKT